jgi:hypothetical protein
LGSDSIVLRVLFFRDPTDPGIWNAQALERDIAAFGKDLEQARRAFEATVRGYFRLAEQRHEEPLVSLKPAPTIFVDAWNQNVRRQIEARQQIALQSMTQHSAEFPLLLSVVAYDQIPAAH